jgi:hypothetical protein
MIPLLVWCRSVDGSLICVISTPRVMMTNSRDVHDERWEHFSLLFLIPSQRWEQKISIYFYNDSHLHRKWLSSGFNFARIEMGRKNFICQLHSGTFRAAESSSECATHINCIKCWQFSLFFGFVIQRLSSLKIPDSFPRELVQFTQ